MSQHAVNAVPKHIVVNSVPQHAVPKHIVVKIWNVGMLCLIML